MQISALLVSGVMLASLPLSLPSGGKDFTRDRTPSQKVERQFKENPDNVIPVGDNAFGEIKLNTPAGESQAIGKGGGGNVANQTEPTAGAEIMPAPTVDDYEPVRYEFVYDGDLSLPEESELPVFKRVTRSGTGKGMAGMIKNLNLGLFNANHLDGLDIQQISLSDDKDFGYIIGLDFVGETVSIFQNYTRWPNPLNDCWKPGVSPEVSHACLEKNALKPDDIPADDELIAIATDFLREYGVSTANYGEPYVNNDWKKYYEQSLAQQEASPEADKMMYMPWVPEQLQVIFPQSHNGEPVYDSAGNPWGLSVSVDIRNNKAAGLYNLTTHTFESSQYPVENDEAKIRDIIKTGGVYSMWSDPAAEKVKQIPLQAPKRGFIQHYNYDGVNQSELAVPVLIFPVNADSLGDSEFLYPQQIIVPLVKDAIDIQQYPPYLMEKEVNDVDDTPEASPVVEAATPSPSPTKKATRISPYPKATATPTASASPTSGLRRFQ